MSNEKVQQNILGLIEKLGFSPNEITITFDEPTNTLWFALSSSNARYLLGRGAEALSSLNHLALKIIEKMMTEGAILPRVVIDANDYERKKIENLKTIAHMMAERARYFKSSIDVDPMPARERRIVHEFLSTIPDIKTESVGEGAKRHIVIKYIEPTKI